MKRSRLVIWGLLVSILFAVVGCGGGGGGGSTSESQPITMSMQGESATYSQQQVAMAKVSNYTLTSDTYTGYIDNTPVTLAKSSDGSLAWIVPALSDGTHTLKLTLNGQTVSVSFVVSNQAVTATLDELVAQLTPDLTTAIDNEIASLTGVTGSESAIAELSVLKTNLANISAQIAALTPEEKQFLTNFIYINFIDSNAAGKSARKMFAPPPDPEVCSDYEWQFLAQKRRVAKDIVVVVGG